MYIPKANEETRMPVLHRMMRSHPFAALVTYGASGILASHVPMIFEAQEEDSELPGVLRCHISRANTQWKDFHPTVEALAIFSGPEHYVSPSWYAEKQATGKVVPTWNYIVVHACGHLRIIEDPEWLRTHVESLTNIHEAAFPEPWTVDDAPAGYIDTLVKGIVGIEMKISRLEGKWKLNQNRSEADRRGVIDGLEALDTPSAQQMKICMLDTLESPHFKKC